MRKTKYTTANVTKESLALLEQAKVAYTIKKGVLITSVEALAEAICLFAAAQGVEINQ